MKTLWTSSKAEWIAYAPGRKAVGPKAIHAVAPPLAKPMPKSRNSLPAALLGLCGVGGLIGLLAASTHYPEQALVLRVLAIAWFLTIGVVKFVLDLRDANPSDQVVEPRRRRGEIR